MIRSWASFVVRGAPVTDDSASVPSSVSKISSGPSCATRPLAWIAATLFISGDSIWTKSSVGSALSCCALRISLRVFAIVTSPRSGNNLVDSLLRYLQITLESVTEIAHGIETTQHAGAGDQHFISDIPVRHCDIARQRNKIVPDGRVGSIHGKLSILKPWAIRVPVRKKALDLRYNGFAAQLLIGQKPDKELSRDRCQFMLARQIQCRQRQGATWSR